MTSEEKVKERYPAARCLTKTITDDQYEGPVYWIEGAPAMRNMRWGSIEAAWADAAKRIQP